VNKSELIEHIARQADIAEFSADIDRLRDDVARLEKRLQRLA